MGFRGGGGGGGGAICEGMLRREDLTLHLPIHASALREGTLATFESSKLHTFVTCVPIILWMPEQSMHINIPRLKLAQVGAREEQSAQ